MPISPFWSLPAMSLQGMCAGYSWPFAAYIVVAGLVSRVSLPNPDFYGLYVNGAMTCGLRAEPGEPSQPLAASPIAKWVMCSDLKKTYGAPY